MRPLHEMRGLPGADSRPTRFAQHMHRTSSQSYPNPFWRVLYRQSQISYWHRTGSPWTAGHRCWNIPRYPEPGCSHFRRCAVCDPNRHIRYRTPNRHRRLSIRLCQRFHRLNCAPLPHAANRFFPTAHAVMFRFRAAYPDYVPRTFLLH